MIEEIQNPHDQASNRPDGPRRKSSFVIRISFYALILLLGLGTVIRFYHIDRESQWVDEFWSVYLSTGRGESAFNLPTGVLLDPPPAENMQGAPSWPHIWTGMGNTAHPPLYHIVLRWWMDIFGAGDVSTRGLSALLSMVGVVVLFDAVRRTSGPCAALAAAAVMTLAVSQIDLSQETRSYTMLALLGLLACHAMIRIEQGGATRGRLIQLCAAVVAAMLTHYFAGGAAVALGVYALVRLRGSDRRKTIAAMCAAALIVLVAWGPWFWWQFQRKQIVMHPDWLLESPTVNSHALQRAVELPARHIYGRADQPLLAGTAVMVYLLPLVLIRRQPQLLLWWFVVVGTVGSLTAIDLFKHGQLTLFPKYTFVATPAVCALLATRLPLRGWRGWLLPCVVVVSVSVATVARLQQGPPPKVDWRAVALTTDQLVGPREPVVFYPGSFWHSAAFWYLAFTHYVPDSHRPVMMLQGPADARALATLSQYPQIWLYGESAWNDGQDLLPGWKCVGGRWIFQAGMIVRMIPPTPRTATVPSSQPTIITPR